MCKKLIFGCFVLAVLVMAVPASATLPRVYVDVNHVTNTVLAPSAGGGAFVPTSNSSGTDNLWRLRDYGNADGGAGIPKTIYEARAGYGTAITENCPRLATTFTVLPGYEGTINVYAYFWSDSSSWRLRAGLTDPVGAELPIYAYNPDMGEPVLMGPAGHGTPSPDPILSDDPSLAPNQFTTAVEVGHGNRRLFQCYLGQVTVGVGGTVTVYLDDDPLGGNSQNYRTWIDGVGYVPEPATIVLLGLGSLMLGRIRKFSRK